MSCWVSIAEARLCDILKLFHGEAISEAILKLRHGMKSKLEKVIRMYRGTDWTGTKQYADMATILIFKIRL